MRGVLIGLFILFFQGVFCQEHLTEKQSNHDTLSHEQANELSHTAVDQDHEATFDPGQTAFHHISDANVFHIYGDTYMPLPCILYAPGQGWSCFMSSTFDPHHHGDGTKAIDRYVLA